MSPLYFFSKYVYIEDAAARKKVKWEAWPYLVSLLDDFGQYKDIVILKARQLGISWAVCGYAVWTALFHDNAKVLLLSYKEEGGSWELIEHCEFILRNLPDFMKRTVDTSTRSTIAFKENGSKIKALPSTEDAGSGFTASLVIRDECELHPYAETNFTAVGPTVDSGGQMIDLASVKKDRITTHFKTRFKEALSGTNGAHPIFLGWRLRPVRDPNMTLDEWFEQKIRRKYPKEIVEQEYPECLHPDTIINTDEGFLPISKSGKAFVSGEGLLWELATEKGRKLYLTKEHRVMTPYGYEELQNLCAGDPILLKQPEFSQQDGSFPLTTRFHNETRTIVMDERWGRFLGLFVGDGSLCGIVGANRISNPSLSIVCDGKDADLVKIVEDDFDVLFGGHHTRKHSTANCYEIRHSVQSVIDVFDSLGLVKPSGVRGQALRKVTVPDCILRASKPIVRAFLAGVFEADGFIQDGRPRIILFSKHEDFLQTIQFLLLGFGITSTIRVADKVATHKGKTHKYIGRELALRRPEVELFRQEIGFLSSRKNGRLNKTYSQSKQSHYEPITMVDKVKSITPSIESVVWDATINDEHCFSANGIWVHNSIEQALSPISVSAFFDMDCLTTMLNDKLEPVDTRHGGMMKIWKLPVVGRRYFAFLDPSDGGEDPHCGVIMDAQTYEVVAHTWGKCPADHCAKYFDELVREYNNAFNDFELNSLAGGKVAQTLDDLGTPNRRRSGRNKEGQIKYGWWTGGTSRSTMLVGLEEAIRNRQIILHDTLAVQELMTFIRSGDGTPTAPGGGHDDYVFALAGAWQIRREMPTATQFRTGYCVGYGGAR